MLRLRRIEIDNFVCFDDVVVEPSTDADKPLTVIRAENGSGKTTFLRALRWGMYGERGLPGDSSRFSLHPAWWQPDVAGIKTRVAIEFETDGSSRSVADSSQTSANNVYQLVRSVTTIGKPAAKHTEPDFRRINEQTQLMVKEGAGNWTRHTAGVDVVVKQLLPWELRDFFVMDADEATDFVGGSENKIITRQDVIKKTTDAVNSLLGIDVFKEAAQRVADTARAFGAKATKAIGDSDLDALQSELDQLRVESAELGKQIAWERGQKAELEDRLKRRRDDLETELKSIGAGEELRTRLKENRRAYARARETRRATLGQLAGELESTDLLSSLATSRISKAYEILKPLYDQGHIPLKHLNFVRDLLRSGTCVCGQDLTIEGIHQRHVKDRIAESAEQEERANFLGQLHDSAKSLMAQASTARWDDRRAQLSADLAVVDTELSNLGLEKRDIDVKLDALDEEKIQVIRDEITTLGTQVSTFGRNLSLHEGELPPITSRIDSLDKQIHQRQRSERSARDMRAAQGMSELVAEVLNRAYATIQGKQIEELSGRMNRLFAQMAANVSDEDFDEIQRNKATLKMIAEVGIRPVEGEADQFEIFALNGRGRSMPPIEINGASRRVLALAFVLAMCTESRTYAPLVADSLLNSMSGAVRRNTLRITAENSRQPILLLTGSDLEATTEIDTINKYADATYTLTGQWAAIDAGGGGDVINWTVQRQVSLLCQCDPREFCDICERTGQNDSPGWTKRT